jgi:hypothetical protein
MFLILPCPVSSSTLSLDFLGRAKAQADALAYSEAQERHCRRPSSASPPATQYKQPYTLKRRDSDTLRNPDVPTGLEALPPRFSPSARHMQSSTNAARHRRSPTAPEPPTTSGVLTNGAGRFRIAGEPSGEEYGGGNVIGDREWERMVPSKSHQKQSSLLQQHVDRQENAPPRSHSAPATGEALTPFQDGKNRPMFVRTSLFWFDMGL